MAAIDARLATAQHPAIAESLMSEEIEFLSQELKLQLYHTPNSTSEAMVVW